jgi:hypothetical protein
MPCKNENVANINITKKCIICFKCKPETDFDKIGEHIFPQSLGNKNLITYHVCHTCNGGLGGTVDYALKKSIN